jgi:hypothetical protein
MNCTPLFLRKSVLVLSLLLSFSWVGNGQNLPLLPDTTKKVTLPIITKKDVKVESHMGRARYGHVVMLGFGFGMPGGELRNRFGNHLHATAGYNLVFPSHWTLGVEASYGFGRNVKQDPLSSLRDANGDIIAKDGSLSTTDITESVTMLPTVKFGRVFVLKKRVKTPDWEHGLLVNVGYSWIQYKYGLNNVSRDVAQLDGDRKKGYDRLASGPGGLAELTYFLQSPKGSYGVFFKGQYYYGVSQSRRVYDYNYQRATTGVMPVSALILQIGFALTFYRLDENDYFYY